MTMPLWAFAVVLAVWTLMVLALGVAVGVAVGRGRR